MPVVKPVILCVDDEAIVLRSLKDQLRRHFPSEVTIEVAESGEEALELLDELLQAGATLPLVISDQMMPGMTGEVFLANVRKKSPKTLSVMLTGQATVEAVGQAVNYAGLYRFMAKPWSGNDLVLTVREALRSWEHARDLDLVHQNSLRFVPREALALLGHSKLTDVTYGDFVEAEMSMFFSDMRHYTTMVESKSHADAFRFINDYMQCMFAPIHSHGGFVGNVEGDAILALFPGTADDAVKAGLTAHRELLESNRARPSERPVAMGLAVNTGRLLLGTVGSEARLQCDVVGDAINLCSRVESLCVRYGANMLLTEHTRARLADLTAYQLRQVDRVQVKGKSEQVSLYEVLDALPEEVAAARIASRDQFHAAREHFIAGRFADAGQAFAAVLARDPTDLASSMHRQRCQQLAADPPPSWNGVVQLFTK